MAKKGAGTTQLDAQGFVQGLTVGLVVGVGIGLLVAPRPGRQTLDMLMDRSDALRDRVAEFLNEARAIARAAERRAQDFPE